MHHFAGQVRDGVVINTEPGVVHDDAWPAVVFDFDGHGRDAEVLVESLDLGQREDHPEAGVDEVGIVVTQEVTVKGGRWMRATLDTALYAFGRPRGIVHGDGGAIVAKSLQVGAGVVRDVLDVSGQVGRTSHLVNEALPGGGGTEASRQIRN